MSRKHYVLMFLVLSFYFKMAVGQVYNYLPLQYSDFESNPSSLVSDLRYDRIQLFHCQSYNFSNPFSYSSLRWSKYNESSFTGIGTALNHTVQDSNSYSHITLAGAYRNVLFNKFFVKFGLAYKLNLFHSSETGVFDYYNFYPNPTQKPHYLSHNLNFSLAFSSSYNRYYVSLAMLNCNLPLTTVSSQEFPVYYVLNAGNLMSIWDRYNQSELSWTGYIKTNPAFGDKLSVANYMNFRLRFYLTRRTVLQYGARIGYENDSFFHIAPILALNKEFFSVSLTQNFYNLNKNMLKKYDTHTGINVIYNF